VVVDDATYEKHVGYSVAAIPVFPDSPLSDYLERADRAVVSPAEPYLLSRGSIQSYGAGAAPV
jgi:hypothetical protein